MKRIFWLLAAAAITITACNKPQYIIPIDDDEEEETPGEEEGFKEKTFVVNISLKEGVNNTYDGTVGTMPGKDILDFLELTQEEFYKGMGTCTTGSMSSSQSDNTVLFGVANKNSADDLKWIPSTSNNFGHWFGKDGAVITWGDEAYFFTESLCEWGASAPDADTYADMWNYTVGCFPGRTAAGETYKATEVFFVTSDDDVELYAYVEWNVTIEAAEEVKLNVVGTQEVTFDTPFNNYGDYPHTPLVPEIDQAALQSAIGVSMAEADVYGVNPDGSFSLAPGKNFWFMTDGTIGSWGAGAGICINDDAGTNEWAWCMFPDESLGGQSLKGAIAFVNPTTLNAYVVKVTVNVEGIDFLNIDVLVSYEAGETVYTLNENNLAALAAALGVESVTAEEIGTTYPLKGINADGSVYEGGFTANNGYWYTLEGNVTDWAGVEAAGYVGAFIEYRGDYNFGCGMWEESGEQSTVKFGIGDAILTFNLTVDQPKAYETTEVGTMSGEATQSLTAGYGGPTLVLDYDAVCSMLDLNDENFAANFKVTATDGTVEYTGEAPGGYWFNAENAICGWGDVNSAYYMNFKYGDDLPEGAEGKLILLLGVRNDNSTDEDGNVTHTCPAPGTYAGVVRLANIETLKHITYTLTFTVTE
jgi:hypothetical protein